MEIEIYAYTMTSDTGFAPCVENGLLTLACCKPRIRKSISELIAQNNQNKDTQVFVVGLCGIQLRNESRKLRIDISEELLYYPVFIAQIYDAPCVADYYGEKYKTRFDQVYRFENGRWFTKSSNPHLVQPIETDEVELFEESACTIVCKKDLWSDGRIGGASILRSNNYIYFGRKLADLKEKSFPPVFHKIANIYKSSPRSDCSPIILDSSSKTEFKEFFDQNLCKELLSITELTLSKPYSSDSNCSVCKCDCEKRKKLPHNN